MNENESFAGTWGVKRGGDAPLPITLVLRPAEGEVGSKCRLGVCGETGL